MPSLVTNANCLYISVFKCKKMTLDGITDDAFELESYSKWKDIYLITNEELNMIICLQASAANSVARVCVFTVIDLAIV